MEKTEKYIRIEDYFEGNTWKKISEKYWEANGVIGAGGQKYVWHSIHPTGEAPELFPLKENDLPLGLSRQT